MSLGACPALDASVLVLNKCYMAVHVIPVRRAFCLLFKELAEVVTLDDGRYLSHDFESWREVSEARARFKDPDDDYIRTIHFEIQVPRVDPPPDLRPAPPDQGQVQPAEHLRPRRQPLPVLRQAVPDRRAEPRPRHAPEPGRRDRLGEHRLRLRPMQRPQGGPDPRRGRHEADQGRRSSPRTSPTLGLKLANRKYQSWKTFLDDAYWTVELK